MNGRNKSAGFTLVEILVAISIFMVLMGGLVMLFVGSLRATRTTIQQMDAFERARGALAIMDDDLSTGFTSYAHGQKDSFYGMPIGMTFIGVTRDSSSTSDTNVARITYAIYNPFIDSMDPNIPDEAKLPWVEFPEALYGNSAFTYYLLRFVEPGVGDLDSFPVNWDTTYLTDVNYDTNLGEGRLSEYIDGLADYAWDANQVGNNKYQGGEADFKDAYRKNKRRELWIRMLAGGDEVVPSWWSNYANRPEPYSEQLYPGKYQARNFVVTEHVIWTGGPRVRYYNWLAGFDDALPELYLFWYKDTNGATAGTWWNDFEHTNCLSSAGTGFSGYCADPRPPEIVGVRLWLMFESPYPGAPDFQRRFDMEITIPTAYRRAESIE